VSLIPYAFDGAAQTMSSREIAELCDKRHDNVMRDTRDVLTQLYGKNAALKFEGSYIGQDGSTRPCFNLPKRETLILVSGYNIPVRAKIVDRWQELEAAQRPDPMVALSDPATMRALLLGYTEKVIALEGRVSELQPKVAAFDLIANLDGSLCITDAAKTLHVKPKVLFHFLRTKKWIYRRGGQGAEIAYGDKLQFGYLEHKITTVNRSDGTERSATQVRVTPAGLSKIAIWFHEQPELGVAP
jgi:phage antirepressor YoqD-like protein